MNVAVRGIASVRNGSGARTTFGGRSFYGSLLALSVSALLLCGNGAALAGPCTTRIIQVERQIADNRRIGCSARFYRNPSMPSFIASRRSKR